MERNFNVIRRRIPRFAFAAGYCTPSHCILQDFLLFCRDFVGLILKNTKRILTRAGYLTFKTSNYLARAAFYAQ